ncbi:hypothetical protein [Curtobacterium sp. MCBA15_007]|uniref:hypothetical protein n=1 Tax=Curtobacterium sp. MCBA15_007 TaxID=1898735 RepID=UPI0011133166|nr:hypothetical protein [Curtobacterium sp. MCBA15_007]
MEATIRAAENATSSSDTMWFHIPRTLRLIYDIRNRRNTAHLRDTIDPNLQDATLIVSTMSWVLAELVREFHSMPAADAQELIEAIVTREVPMIQEFGGFPRLLKTVPASEHCLVLLYWVGRRVSRSELSGWLPLKMRKNLSRTLPGFHERHMVHVDTEGVEITHLGQRVVESGGLIAPI